MNHPGTLRHSRAHRAVVQRQQATQMVAYVIEVEPIPRGSNPLEVIRTIRELVCLPAGAIVTHQEVMAFGNVYRLCVEIPRTARIDVVDRCVTVRKLWPMKKINPHQKERTA